ncbi:MAG: hypothetical protein U0264_02835 [Candidatus Kapaibacterium sp.]
MPRNRAGMAKQTSVTTFVGGASRTQNAAIIPAAPNPPYTGTPSPNIGQTHSTAR